MEATGVWIAVALGAALLLSQVGAEWALAHISLISGSTVLGGIGAVAAAAHRRRERMFQLRELYTSTQDICRDALGATGGKLSPEFEREVISWWRLVREVSPVLSKRGRRFLSELHGHLTDLPRIAHQGEPRTQADRLKENELLKRIADCRSMVTSDRDIFITKWPARLDWVRTNLPFRGSDKSSGLSG